MVPAESKRRLGSHPHRRRELASIHGPFEEASCEPGHMSAKILNAYKLIYRKVESQTFTAERVVIYVFSHFPPYACLEFSF